MLLTLDGIKGSFNADSYKDAIEVSAYSFGGADDVMSGSGGGKTTFTDIQLKKTMDASSLPLLKALAKGQHIKDGYLYFQANTDSGPITYMIIHFTNLLVTGYQVSSGGGRHTKQSRCRRNRCFTSTRR